MIRSWPLMAIAGAVLILQSALASAAVVIKNVTIIDGTGRPAQTGRSVLIDGDRIAAIRDHDIKAPAGAAVIDGSGKFLIPGMADTHIHLDGGRDDKGPATDIDTGRRLLQGYLYDGVTFVYDAGNYDKYIFAMRDAERSGRMISPRVFATGSVTSWTNGAKPGSPLPTYEERVKTLDALLVQKPDLLKFYDAPHLLNDPNLRPSFDHEIMHRLIMYANERGYRTTIHAVESATQRAAVEAGINDLAHPVYIDEADDKLAPMIAAKGIPVTTTLVVIKNIYELVESQNHFDTPEFRALLTDKDLAHLRDDDRKRYASTHLEVWAHRALANASVSVKKLYDAGATLALGTDRTVGEYVPQELELIVGLGIPPLQALRIATLNAAIYLRTADRMGSVEEGKLADLVLLNADPSKDVRNVRAISSVILGGKIVDRSKLELPVNHLAK